ncbi:MAG: hypothetical protein K2K85_04860 [Clostridia bacterium]|nr:hypothetical protein [Clostridia bacterium]
MSQSKIIQILYDVIEEHDTNKDSEYIEQFDEVIKWEKILGKYMEEDKKFKEILFNYNLEYGSLCSMISRQCFQDGFLCGARLALEICGFERAEKL